MAHDIATGIPVAKLDDYVETLKKSMDLDDKICEELKTIAYIKTKDKVVLELKYNTEFESKYGYIAMTRNSDDEISCAYAFHSLTFKLADRRIETRAQKKFWFINLGETVSVSYEPVRFGTKDIETIKSTYMRYKALEAMRKEGIIQEISFED